MTYRAAVGEIEEILRRLEGDRDIDVDELVEDVERASTLLRSCSDRLKAAELRVQVVTDELSQRAQGDSREEQSRTDASD